MVKVKGDLLALFRDHLWPRCMPSFFVVPRRVTHSSVGDGRAPLYPLLVPRSGSHTLLPRNRTPRKLAGGAPGSQEQQTHFQAVEGTGLPVNVSDKLI